MNAIDSLSAVPLLRGIPEEQLVSLKAALDALERAYPKDAVLLRQGSVTSRLGIVLEGSVSISRTDYDGQRNLLSRVGPGGVFAETYAMLPGEPLMVTVTAAEGCRVLWLDMQKVRDRRLPQQPWVSALMMNLLNVYSRKNLELTRRGFFTAPHRLRERLLAYLSSEADRRGSRVFDIPFDRQQLADYLNADRSALSAELCRLRDEGVLRFRKNHFELCGTGEE